ncbi:MAG TPA: LTA synthase family protein [Candidatus Competibacteraceae bacterium]|nr:LTA synthase family protein [Candidatus Competibacteraceae bacterium]HRZ05350.1 LTA synthase family protein [Candidatus Competibacteraceae bacterium]HSA45158.1 LTA synthase family protein [Candidatus Competibacteraceae bacterium]
MVDSVSQKKAAPVTGRFYWAGRYGLVLDIVLTVVLVFSLTRLALALRVGGEADWTVGTFFTVAALGLLYDLTTALLLALPFGLWLTVLPERWVRFRATRLLIGLALASGIFALLFNAAAEWLFWDEFSSRFNFIAVDYLVYTNEVIGNIRQSYPAGWILGGLGGLALLGTLAVRRRMMQQLAAVAPFKSRLIGFAVHALLALGLLAVVSGDARENLQNAYARELAGNGPFELVRAFKNNELEYQRFYPTLPEQVVYARLREEILLTGGEPLSADPHDLRYRISAQGPELRPNVVVVMLESMSADFMATFGNPHHLTPTLDRLTGESLFFPRAFASGTRTVRGLEALALALPPTPGNAIVRRPHNEHLFSLASVFNAKGYASAFLYGGYGYFDNMNAFFGGNGYTVIDRLAVNPGKIHHETIWGIADEDLYTEALETFDTYQAKGQPFFAHLMTTSNHRPYTYPEGRIDIPSKTGREGAVKYADWALGDFLQRAAGHAWFDNTVFVIVADHQASASGKTDLPLARYRIPLLIYAPKLIPPARNERLIAQMDIAPTLLGLLNWSYTSKFIGHDVNRLPPGKEHVLISTYQTVGYLENNQLVILEPGQRVRVEAVDWKTLTTQPAAADPVAIKEAISVYEGVSLAFKAGLLQAVSP